MKHPYSVLTNAAFGVVGVLAFLVGEPLAVALGASLVLLSLGSGLYHYFLTEPTQALDEIGMYAVIAAALAHQSPWGSTELLLVLWFVTTFSAAALYHYLDSHILVPAGIAGVVLLTMVSDGHPITALVLLSGAVAAAALRAWGERLEPDGGDLQHGLWHVVMAATIWVLL